MTNQFEIWMLQNSPQILVGAREEIVDANNVSTLVQ